MQAHITDIRTESWPIAGRFTISRGAKTAADVIVVIVSDGTLHGCGEAVPYVRYGETIASTCDQLRSVDGAVCRAGIQARLPAGAARNALDCALWDLEAKRSGHTVHELAGMAPPRPVTTAFTLSLASPGDMAATALLHTDKPLLKLKLAGDDQDVARIAAVRSARDDANLIVDANEALSPAMLAAFFAACAANRVSLIEQPLPADADDALADLPHPVPVCADESAHTCRDLARLCGRYDAVNIKLDKTGGLTEAVAMAKEAERIGLRIMVGCMVSTSLSMAPAFVLTPSAEWVDLDGPLLLARDRVPSLTYDGAIAHPPSRVLWG